MGKRSQLLPPYLESNPVWRDLIDSADAVFDTTVDQPVRGLSKLRHTYIIPEATEDKIRSRNMLDFSDFDQFERSILVEQVNLLGLSLNSAGLLDDSDYQRLYRNLSLFWYSKGTNKFIDFIGFCLNASFTMTQLWANNDELSILKPAGDPAIGTSVVDGGDWFPTTLVDVSYDAQKFANVDINDVVKLFYEFANYDLVLHSVGLESTYYIGDNPNHNVQLGGIIHRKVKIKSWEDDVMTVQTHLGGLTHVQVVIPSF